MVWKDAQICSLEWDAEEEAVAYFIALSGVCIDGKMEHILKN